MTDPHCCPLCTETYDDRTDLRVHLEVEHRKSEVVSFLVELDAAVTDISSEREPPTVDDGPQAPSA
ncbi:hypothetical protein [Natrinema salaciae]|uniref:C2H2-type domain-containing protein n=1 Tax=Natrinema salaciae TaxID=1186196 RepID=A0A1H9B2A0_9EURY|nr:hypothetical protein [Natrinema salaciae]SEP83162.1 hypothetical protein SAMN04489841_0614 [Natrinema salaciae]